MERHQNNKNQQLPGNLRGPKVGRIVQEIEHVMVNQPHAVGRQPRGWNQRRLVALDIADVITLMFWCIYCGDQELTVDQ